MSIQAIPASAVANRTDAPSGKDPKAWKAAQDFEAILMRQILQSMRKTTQIIADTEQDGSATQMQDMAWDGLGDQFAKQGGIGLAKALYPQLVKNGTDLGRLDIASHPAIPTPAAAPVQTKAAYPSESRPSLDAAIEKAAKDTGLPANLIKAVVHTESGGDTKARSAKGAIGPMQLMPATAAELGVDPWNPSQNIAGGSRYLASLKARFGDDKLALAAYNAGPGAVQRHGGIPPFAETQAYVKKVIATRDRLAAAGK